MMTLLSRIGHHLLNSHGGMAPFGAFWARHDAAVHKRRPAEANTMQKTNLAATFPNVLPGAMSLQVIAFAG